ncbi:hypothetical protein GAYE_SCF27MG4694 [Galdieria yellowstonensis]|uniref:Uncharacterized protein n=1 Tax=Galdieria yellowstonensis TaxID=3028027 RepID=A0AAV9IH66_9RHOD|nr:hypothetical protein GAYE_SCF27MG4694 [Galdieria yellowstonensis]
MTDDEQHRETNVVSVEKDIKNSPKSVSFRDVYAEGKEKPYLSGYAARKRTWLHEAFGSMAAFGGAALGGLLTLHRIEIYLLKKFPKQWVLHGFIVGPPTATVGAVCAGLFQGIVKGCFPPDYSEKGPRWLESDSYAGLRVAQIEKTPDMSYTKQRYLQAVNAELSPTLPIYVGFMSCVGFPMAAYKPLYKKCMQVVSVRFPNYSQRRIALMASVLNSSGLGLLSLCGFYLMPPFASFLLRSHHIIAETLEGVGFDIQTKYRKSQS